MLFRKYDGTIVKINRADYKNDAIYYTFLMKVKANLKETPIKVDSNDAIQNLLKEF